MSDVISVEVTVHWHFVLNPFQCFGGVQNPNIKSLADIVIDQ